MWGTHAATGDVVAQRRCRQHDRRQRRDRAARRRRPVHARVDDHGPRHRRRHGVARRHRRSGERGTLRRAAPQRLVDTRIPAGTTLESGATTRSRRSGGGDIEFDADGRLGVPSDGTASAVALDRRHRRAGSGGFAGAFPTGTTWSNTSNINVVGADIRANMVVVPFGSNGHVSVKTLNIADAVVDVLGYITSASAPASTSGRYRRSTRSGSSTRGCRRGLGRSARARFRRSPSPTRRRAGRRAERDRHQHRRAGLGRHLPGVGHTAVGLEPELRRQQPNPPCWHSRRCRRRSRSATARWSRPISSSTSSARSLRDHRGWVVSG